MTRKKPAPEPNLAVFVLVDESGSMQGFWSQTIKAVNDYIAGLTLVASPAEVSVVAFGNGKVRTLIDRRPSYDLPEITNQNYHPSGGTPLLQAMGEAMERLDQIKAKQKAIIVITDGESDGSREWPPSRVAKEVKARIADGWLFLYIAANGMEETATDFAIPRNQALPFSQSNTERAMMVAAMATLRYQGSADAKRAVFTPEERKLAKCGQSD